MKRILLAFSGEKTRTRLTELFASSDLTVAAACSTGEEALAKAGALEIDLLICGSQLPDLACEQLYHRLPAGTAMLVLGPQEQLDRIDCRGIETLPAPVRGSDLLAKAAALTDRTASTVPKRTEEERLLITRAKELLMEKCFMTEAQAHRFLQRYSMDTGSRMADTARRLLEDPKQVIPAEFFES